MKAGSNERLYAVYGGNDGRVMLLTPEMHAYIRSIGDVLDHRWMPYPAGEVEDRQMKQLENEQEELERES